jgi:hypothetical protein
MLRLPSLALPPILPTPAAIRSHGDNHHSYEPEFWEFQYEVYRYLGRVAPQDLVERYRAIIRNMKTLIKSERHVIPIQSPLSSWYWFRKEHQTRLEFAMRGVSPPAALPTGLLDRSSRDAPTRPSSPNAGDVLFRYSERNWIEEMVHLGRIRIGPAAFYRNLELGVARADEERAKTSFLAGEYVRIISKDGMRVPIVGDVRRTVSLPNYYMLCLSCEWDPALFSDFRADACAVVRDGKRFAERLQAASKEQLDGWYFHHGPVEYFDPYQMSRDQFFDAGMCKDFRFAFEREYRFLWVSLAGEEADNFKVVKLGPLEDIAEVHAPDAQGPK